MRWMYVSLRVVAVATTVGVFLSGVKIVRAVGVASIRLTAERDVLLADGKSTTTLTAEVRDDQGAVVPDGTTIRFSTTAGRLDTTTATTQNGVARVTLTGGELPGVALVTAHLEGRLLSAPAQLALSFVTDAQLAEAGSTWARIDADYVGYAVDSLVIQANRRTANARVSYRGVAIAADVLQLNVQNNTVRAIGNVSLEREGVKRLYANLRYELLTGQGVGERDEDGRPRPIAVAGPNLAETMPGETVRGETFALEDLSLAALTIVARSIALEPNVRLQFRRAAFYLDGSKVLSLPYHVMALGQVSLFSEQVVGYGPNGMTVDFPLYYDVRPSAVGTLHVRRGARVGSSAYATRPGWSLDIEHAYNGSSGTDGTLEVTGVTRQDWGARWTHGQRLDARSRGSLYVDFPNHRDLFANALASRSFRGFSVNATLAGSRTALEDVVSGTRNAGGDWRGQVYGETDAHSVSGAGPLRYTIQVSTARQGFYGPSAQPGYNTHTAGVRLFTAPLPLSRQSTLTQSLSVGQTFLSGSRARKGGASILGTVALNHALGRQGSTSLTYDYTQTPQQNVTLASGQHRLGANLFAARGDRWNLSLTGTHTLDGAYSTLYGNLSFGLGGPWRGRVALTASRFSGFRYQDVEYALVRRIAGRDIALYYSTTSRRFQLDLTGARF